MEVAFIMKVCPKCRHICEDTDQWCSECNYHMISVKTIAESERPPKKPGNKFLPTIVAVVIVVVVIALIVAFFPGLNTNNYTFPEWIQNRMQYGKTGAVILPRMPWFF